MPDWLPSWQLPRGLMMLDTGVDLAYVDLPPVDATRPGRALTAAHPTLVLLHGYTNDADSWAATAATLRELLPGCRLVIPDLRGHGASALPRDGAWRSDPAGAFTMGDMASDIAELMVRLELGPAVVVGHSMGSLIAQALALSRPDLLSSLILVSSTGDARGAPFLSDWLRDDVIAGQWRSSPAAGRLIWPEQAMGVSPFDLDPDAVAWMQQLWNFYPLTPGRSTREQAERAARLPLATWVGALDGILRHARLAELQRLTVPTFAMWATQDSFFRRAMQESLIAALAASSRRGGRFVWKQYGHLPLPDNGIQVDDLGHNLTWDAPTEVGRDIAAFAVAGAPTTTWFRSNAPSDPYRIIAEPNRATLVVG